MKDARDQNRRQAVALLYDPSRAASPQVVANGRNEVADRIVEKARESGVHIHKDPVLADLLQDLPMGQEIPEELYSLIAEILVFVYRLENRQP